MPSLQKKISYGGDLKNAPVKSINLEFKIPVYEYFKVGAEIGDADKKTFVDRKIVATETITVTQAINSKDYWLDLGENFVVGDDSASLFKQYFSESLAEKNLENLSVKVDVDYFADQHFRIGRPETLNLLFFPKLDPNLPRADYSAKSFKNLIAISKEALVSLLHQFSSNKITLDEMVLLTIISILTDLTEGQPPMIKKLSTQIEQLIFSRMPESPSDNKTKALKVIKDGFDSLFDFPLTIPEIKTLALGGTFTILTSDKSKVTAQDLMYYDLSAEYSVYGTNKLQTRNYKFDHKHRLQDTDETVKVCAYNFSEGAFLQAKQAIIELRLRTI